MLESTYFVAVVSQGRNSLGVWGIGGCCKKSDFVAQIMGAFIGLRLHGLDPIFKGGLRISAKGASCVLQCKFATVNGFYIAVAAFS